MPHVFVILFIMMILVTFMTYVIPSGSYERVENESGTTVINPDSFQFIEKTDPIGFQDFFTSIYTGVVNGVSIMANVMICSGCLALLTYSKALEGGVQKLSKLTKGKSSITLVIFFLYFAGMNIMGAGEGCYPFFPIVTAIIVSLGYDRMVAAGTIMFAATAGFACGMVNLFTTGVSQQIVGLPTFSGMWYRGIVFLVLFVIGLASVLIYAARIKKDPNKSYIADDYRKQLAEQEKAKAEGQVEEAPFGWKQGVTLLLFLALILFLAYGCLNLGFGLGQFSAYYLVFAILVAIIFRVSPSRFCELFIQGVSQVLTAAFVIGLANSILVLLNQGSITDTLVYYMANALDGRNAIITLALILLFVTALNFLVTSGSGKAVIMMPILSPLGTLLGINQQVMVLTYQLGDGLTNMLWPGGGLICCSLCGIDYGDWIKMAWKAFVSMIAAGYILIVIANAIGYGPF